MNNSFGYFEENQLSNIRDRTIWLRLARYIKPYWQGAVAAIFLSILIIGSSLYLPFLVRAAIDDYIINQTIPSLARHSGLLHIGLLFILLSCLGFVANFFQVTLLEWSGQHFMHDMRQDLFKKILSQDLEFFNNNPSGKLVTRLTNDIQNMHEMFTSVIITLFNDFLQLGAILIVLFWLNWRLGLFMAAFLPLIIFLSYYFSIYARVAFRGIRTGVAKLNSFLQEAISGINILQICLRERDTENKFRKQSHDYYLKTIYQIKIFGIFMPLIDVLGTASIATIIIYGGNLVVQQEMSLGTFTAFLFYMRLFFKPVRELSQKYSIVQSAMASAERIFELLDRESHIVLAKRPLQPASCEGRIEFKGVSFGYTPTERIIESLDLTIMPGEMVALVGSTGSGKSTIVNLLERLYDPLNGRVSLDRHDLRDLDITWLRKQIGLVLQDVIILPTTLRENITFGLDIPENRLFAAVNKAQMTEVVARLPEGLETVLGEGGFQLSAGQKQLLSLSRTILRDPKIIVLDEATANIDSSTEILLEKAMQETIAGRTVIIIAHRLSTIKRVDRIIVLEKGKIVEQGDHSELLRKRGRYQYLLDFNK